MPSDQENTPSRKRKRTTSFALPGRAGVAYARKRSVAACNVCRARRTKCDQKKPACSFCESTGAECTTDLAPISTYDAASIAILQRLDSLDQKLDALSTRELACGGKKSASSLTATPETVLSLGVDHMICALPENVGAILKWPIFRRHIGCVVTANDLRSPISVRGPSESFSLGVELEPSLCNRLLEMFFTNVHVKNPVLDEQHARQSVRRLCFEGFGWDAQSALALLICANGALIRPFPESLMLSEDTSDKTLASSLFNAAQKRMGQVFLTADVTHARCIFFTGVYLMSVMRPFDAWRMFVQGLAQCQNWGGDISVDSSSTEGANPPSLTAEQSIYWSCWKSERELRLELDLPDFRTPTVQPPLHLPDPPRSCANGVLQAWYFYLSEISLWRLEAEAKIEISALADEKPIELLDRLPALNEGLLQRLTAWHESLAPAVSLSHDLESHVNSDVLKFVLQGRVTYLQELMSWPFLWASIHWRAAMLPAQTREWVAKGANFHFQRLMNNQSGFYYRHHGTWLMIRSSARSVCLLVALAQIDWALTLMPVGWRDIVDATINMLQFWENEAPGTKGIADAIEVMLSLT